MSFVSRPFRLRNFNWSEVLKKAKGLNFFQQLPAECHTNFAQAFRLEPVAAEDFVCVEGDPVDALTLIMSGQVALFKRPQGAPLRHRDARSRAETRGDEGQFVCALSEGDSFGVTAFVNSRPISQVAEEHRKRTLGCVGLSPGGFAVPRARLP